MNPENVNKNELESLKTQNESLKDQVHVLQEVVKVYQSQLVDLVEKTTREADANDRYKADEDACCQSEDAEETTGCVVYEENETEENSIIVDVKIKNIDKLKDLSETLKKAVEQVNHTVDEINHLDLEVEV